MLFDTLSSVNKLSIDVDWAQLGDFQYTCLKNGLNGVGIPDLIIAQNAIRHNCSNR